MEVSLKRIYPNPGQPRKYFDEAKLEELAMSVKEQGLIEPIVVVDRPQGDKDFMIVAGERRWRACQLAGLTTAPVRFIRADDVKVAEMALIENIQREDLKPLEEARAFKNLLDTGHTVNGLCHKLGFKHPWKINWRINLLNLYEKFQEALEFELISQFEAYEMSRLKAFEDQDLIFHKIRRGELKGQTQVRRFINALIEARKQPALFDKASKEKQVEVVTRWERSLGAVTNLVCASFSPRDCEILGQVFKGDTEMNITKIDLIIGHLKMVKAAMLDNLSARQAKEAIEFGISIGLKLGGGEKDGGKSAD